MTKVKKPIGYYIAGFLFLIGIFVNITSSDSDKWAAILWAALSTAMFILAYKKSNKYKEQKARDEKVFNKLKDFYESVLNGNDLNKTDQIFSEIANTENIPEPQIKGIAEEAVKAIMSDTVSKETASGSLSPNGYDNILTTAKKLNIDLQIDKKTGNTLSKLL